MTSLGKRVVTAAVLVCVLLAALFLLPPDGINIFVSVVFLIGCWEWSGFLRRPLWVRVVFVLAGLVLGWAVATQFVESFPLSLILYGAVIWWSLVTVWLALHDIRYGALLTAVAGALCLLPAWMSLLRLLAESEGAWLTIWMVCIVAAADTGAYFAGKTWGRHKLAPRLSPGKTREGFVGGLVAATLVACLGAWLLDIPPGPFLLIGPVLAAVSVVGDLTVSAFKRNAGLKDTGWILPGHGGVMDRIDSLVAAAPLFLLGLSLSGVIVV